jgi:hypothetical protein
MNKLNKLNKVNYTGRYICNSVYTIYTYVRDNYCIIRHNDDDDIIENKSLPNAYQMIDRY